LVEAPANDPPANKEDAPATPAPPQPAPQWTPQAPHPASPYGQSPPLHSPGPEIGLMVSESLFGMLTAAGSSLLLYYLVLKNFAQMGTVTGGGGDMQTISTVIFLLGFGAVPLAVSQTEVGIANGSRYYSSEGWPASLSGLGAQAAVLRLYYMVRGSLLDGGEAVLLIGTCVGVPLVEMAVINLTKRPRWRLPAGGFREASLITVAESGELRWSMPVPLPAVVPGARGPELGTQLSLLRGRF